MKAMQIHLNGQHFCLAGMPVGGVEVSIGLTRDQSDGRYSIAVYGCDLATEKVSVWPSADLNVGDEVKIVLVEVNEVDSPEF